MTIRGTGALARRRGAGIVAVLTAGALVAAACSSGNDGTPADDDAAAVDDDPGDTTSTTDVLDNPKWRNVVVGPEPRDDDPQPGGSIVVALESEANTYMPNAFQAGRASFNVAYAIYDPLVARDSNGELQPYLAESIEPNGDFTEWTLRLREDVRFHDNTPLNAASLKRIFDDYLRAEGTATRTALQPVDRMEVVDELTVRYVTIEPMPGLPELLELPAGWPFSPVASDDLGDDFGDQPVGTGPFKFVRWQRDGDLVVERNEDYWQEGLPYLDELTFRVIPDEATRVAALRSGDVDAFQGGGLSPFVAELADIDDVEVMLGPGNRGPAVVFNTAEAPTDDMRIRQALAHAVDQKALIRVVAGEAGELTEVRTQFFTSDSPFYSQAVADAWLEHDPQTAAELYQSYVDDPERSDGKAVGEPVSVTFDVANSATGIELAMAYERFYEDVGFEVTVDQKDQPDVVAAALSDDFQVLLSPGIGDNRSPLGEFQFVLGNPDDAVTNFSNFHDETVASVIERLRSADSLDEQAALAEELGLHLTEQVPLQWIGGDLSLIATHMNVKGVRSWTFPDGALGDGTRPSVTFWSQVWRNESE